MLAPTASASPPASWMAATVLSSEPARGCSTFLEGAGRADHAAAFGREEPGDVGADAAARAGDHHDLAVESAHDLLRAAIVHDGGVRSTRVGPGDRTAAARG